MKQWVSAQQDAILAVAEAGMPLAFHCTQYRTVAAARCAECCARLPLSLAVRSQVVKAFWLEKARTGLCCQTLQCLQHQCLRMLSTE